jgi:cytoskeletal protein RodZ
MTRTDVVASSRPQKADAAPSRKGSSALRKLAVLPVAFALMMAFVLPTGAFAAEEGLSNYNNKPATTGSTPTSTPAPAPTPTPTPTSTSGTSPEKAESTPTKTTAPAETSKEPTKTTPTTTTEPAKASTLPFTGFDLRWTVAAGVLLLAMGFSIVAAQRRQGRKTER